MMLRSKALDSTMSEFNIQKPSRMELIYTCISKPAIHVKKMDSSVLPDDLKHYTSPNIFNRMAYPQRNTNVDDCIKQLLLDADKLLALL